jgi:RND family efflux transporter MFP subunit
MNKKMIAYALLGFFFVWSLFQLPLIPKARLEGISEDGPTENIIAPAIIDSLNDVTRVSTLQSGVVKAIHVTVGDKVKKGQPLFSLDSTLVENNLTIQRIRLEEAKNALRIQERRVKHVQAQLARLRSIDKRAISRADLQEKNYEVGMDLIQLNQAEQNVALAKANVKNAELTLSQFQVTAPKDGVVLQINSHLNEFVGATQPVMFIGDAKKIIVRVSLDERDIERFHPKSKAYLTSNDHTQLKIPLTFMQLQRYIVTQERLNSRVQEVLYYFNREDYPHIVAGQQFDADITVRKNA